MLMAQSKAKGKKLRVLLMYTLKRYTIINYFRKLFYKKMKK